MRSLLIGSILPAAVPGAPSVRADSIAPRACPRLPNAAAAAAGRMPAAPGDVPRMAPMPQASPRRTADA